MIGTVVGWMIVGVLVAMTLAIFALLVALFGETDGPDGPRTGR